MKKMASNCPKIKVRRSLDTGGSKSDDDQKVHRTRPPEIESFNGGDHHYHQLLLPGKNRGPPRCNSFPSLSSPPLDSSAFHRCPSQLPFFWRCFFLNHFFSSSVLFFKIITANFLLLLLINSFPVDGALHHHHSSSSLVLSNSTFLNPNLELQSSINGSSHYHQHYHHNRHHHKRQSGDPLGGKSGIEGINPGSHSDQNGGYAYYATSNKSINFTHLEVDPFTGAVYVGAVNWVLQLAGETLRVQHAVRTGPIRDSIYCAPADCTDGGSELGSGSGTGSGSSDSNPSIAAIQVTNNVNKVLLVEPYSRMLIVCGSVHQGACARHRLEDISTHEELVPIPVAANDENSSTIAFVVPARYYGVQLTPILYVAATDSRLGPYRDMVPAISGRSLEPANGRLFNIVERTFADTARVDISTHLKDYFTIRYVAGFASGDYIYFAAVQRRSHLRALEEWGYNSRLGRVCASDAGFHTYAELTLECVYEPSLNRGGGGGRFRSKFGSSAEEVGGQSSQGGKTEEFNLLQDAFLIKSVGTDLADLLNIERGSSVLAGVFSSSIDHTQRPGSKSALCLFPVAEIEARFAENIHLCYNGSVFSRNMDYIAGSVNTCPEPGTGNVFNFCNEAVKLNGSLALRSQAAIVYRDGTILTAVTAAATAQHTVAFLGTNYGSVKKVLLQSGDFGEQFDEVVIDEHQPVLADIFLDAETNPKHLIAASPYKVVKIPVETCVQHDSCDRCLQARNPYCGWCSLQKKCTIKAECNVVQSSSSSSNSHSTPASTFGGVPSSPFSHPNRHHHQNHNLNHHYHHHNLHQHNHHLQGSQNHNLFSTPRWLSLETSQCIDFQAIKPEYLPRDVVAPVELIINQLPPLPYGANYLCVFEASSPIPATLTRHGLTCQTPSLVSRPPIPRGEDHTSVNVAVRSSETDTDFIHRSFVFFDCSVHKSCKSCVSSAWNCNWCMHENQCTYNTSTCTRRVIVGENSPTNSLIKGQTHCPSFHIETPLLVPDGARKELRVEVRNLIPSQDGFQCIVEIEQAKEQVVARVQDNNIICHETTLSYQEEVGEQNATLTVLWNGDTFIDRTNVTLYKCQFLGAHTGRPDCSLCGTRDSRYRCVWCGNGCTYVDQCSEPPVRPAATSCPPPRIDYIHPISGPVEGGTLVTIEGSNLGASLEEIKDRLSIGGIPCTPIEYNVSVRVICRTGQSITGPQPANVVIGNRAGVTRAQAKFQYKTIELHDISPKMGPQSGGSRIYLSGRHLNIGSSVAVFLDELPCLVERALASSGQLVCRTTAAPYPSYVVSRLLLVIDGANLSLANPFLYTADPTISRVEPLQSFFSGGRTVVVTGTGFTAVQQPRMVVMTRKYGSGNLKKINPTVSTTTSTSTRSPWSFGATFNGVQRGSNSGGVRPYSSPVMTISTTALVPTEATVAAFSQRLINDSVCTVLSSVKMICPSPMINGNLELLAAKIRAAASLNSNSNNPFNSFPPGPVNIFPASSSSSSTSSNNNHNYSLNMIPDQLHLQLGFLMDDALSVLELDTYYQALDSTLLYVADPVIYSLSNGRGQTVPVSGSGNPSTSGVEETVLTVKTGDVLVVEGEGLAALPLAEGELNITVGTAKCAVASVSMRQIICSPPTVPPAPTDETGRKNLQLELPAVVLRIGSGQLRRHLGYLHYGDYFVGFSGNGFSHRSEDGSDQNSDTHFYHQNAFNNRFDPSSGGSSLSSYFGGASGGNGNGSSSSFNFELLIGILALTGTALAVISIVVLAAYRHKTTEAEREYRRIQLQMDTLESNVRSECKQAFAELQTDILQASGLFSLEELHQRMAVPVHDERTFLLRMMMMTLGNFGDLLYTSSSQESAYFTYGSVAKYEGGVRSSKGVTSNYLKKIWWQHSPYFNLKVTLPPVSSQFQQFEQQANNPYGITTGGENFYTLNSSRAKSSNNRVNTLRLNGGIPNPISGVDPSNHSNLSETFLETLLLNRNFILVLVEVLESQSSFTSVDRAHFASLLTLTLLDRMELAFDVMRHLLARQIDHLMGSKGAAPFLMVKKGDGISGESVAEKMLIDWLSVCLFKYVKEVASGPMYLLHSALKHQIEKGPVDAVTGMSRYSLSEDRLLQEQIEYRTLTVYVSVDDRLQQLMPPPPPPSPPNNLVQGVSSTTLSRNRSTIGCRSAVGTLGHNNVTTTTRRPSTLMSTSSTLNRGRGRTAEEDEVYDHQEDHCDRKASEGGLDAPGAQGSGGGSSGNSSASPSTGTTSAGTTSVSNGNSNYLCRLLDCDTISQAKEKILDTLYRSVGASQRPDLSEITLYWRCLKTKSNLPTATTATTGSSTGGTDHQPQPPNSNSSNSSSSREVVVENHQISSNGVLQPREVINNHPSSLYTIQDIYGVASMMSKADADKIYNASRRSDTTSLLLCEVAELPLENYDASTQMLTANEATWRRLNTLSHYGIGDGAQLVLSLRAESLVSENPKALENSSIPNRYPKQNNQLPPPPAPALQISSPGLKYDDLDHDNDDEDDQQSELNGNGEHTYHLYESIPAMYYNQGRGTLNKAENGPGTTPSHQDSLYNLSNTSSSNGIRQAQRNNGGHLLSNYYHLGNHSGTLNRSTIYGPATYDVIGNGRPGQPNSTILGPEEMYGGSSAAVPNYRYGPNVYSPSLMSTTMSPANYSRQGLLTRNQSANRGFLTSSRVVGGNDLLGGRNRHHHHNRGHGHGRSLARSFYDRLSSFVRPSRANGFGTAATGFKFGNGSSMGFNGSSFGDKTNFRKDELGTFGGDEEEDELLSLQNHNVWHLVKPSTLIADCIIGASGSFLYEVNPNDKNQKFGNAQTMRQRRAALRRHRQKNAFFGRNRTSGLNNRINAQSLTSAASAALSASQMNLHSVNANGNHNQSPPLIMPSSSMIMTSPSSPLSAFTSSASNFFASIFGSKDTGSEDHQVDSTSGIVPKSIPEIYLTRLLSTKGTVQQYVDDLVTTIFTVNERLPIAIKWLFDFLDAASASASVQTHPNSTSSATILATTSDHQTTLVWSDALGRQWKSNILVGQFWADLLCCPELLFDIGVHQNTGSSSPVDICLEVLATNLCEAAGCALVISPSKKGLGKENALDNRKVSSSCRSQPSIPLYTGSSLGVLNDQQSPNSQLSNCSPGKLLFARDIAAYRALINQYYAEVAQLPPISEADILAYMKDVSKAFEGKVCKERSVSELISYCLLYKEVIFAALTSDPTTQREHLHLKFESLIYAAAAASVSGENKTQNLFQNSSTTLPRQPAAFYQQHPPAAFSLSNHHGPGISRV